MKTEKSAKEDIGNEEDMEGSEKEEAKETPSEESKEDGGQEGVHIPEDFQKSVYELIESCENREQLDYIRSCVSKKESEMMKAETKKAKGKNPTTMGVFSADSSLD